MEGDTETGVTVMRMDAGLDTGPTAKFRKLRIEPEMTAGELHDRLARLGADLMVCALDALERDTLRIKRQPETGIYAAKINSDERRIDWRQPWRQVHDHIRGLSPFPGAWFEFPVDGKPVRVKVLRTTKGEGGDKPPGTVLDDRLTIACGEGAVRILQLQRAGGRAMAAEEFLRGTPLAPGARLA